jgi:hypothetical protein
VWNFVPRLKGGTFVKGVLERGAENILIQRKQQGTAETWIMKKIIISTHPILLG